MGIAELARVLNKLREAFPAAPVLCIPWLHLKHPLHPVQRELLGHRSIGDPVTDVEAPQNWIRATARRVAAGDSWILRALLCLANAIRLSAKVAGLKLEFRNQLKAIKASRIDVVAKTWCFGPARRPNEPDFYYGDLQERLARQSVQMLLLCGDANDTPWRPFARSYFSIEPPLKAPELCMVPITAPLTTACSQIGASLRLRRHARAVGDELFREVAKKASLDVLLPAVTQPSLLFHVAKESVRLWDPAAFVTLYEGHGWEKASWWGAKSENPRCRTVGYQHTLLFPETLSILQPFVDERDRSVPDVVLALGVHTACVIDAGHRAYGVQTIPFGSFRYDVPKAVSPADPALRSVLVAPEGITSEMELMIGFAADCARIMPSYRFILRVHPKWQSAKALSSLLEPAQAEPNIILSECSLDDDLKRSSLLVYRGSSVVLHGILSGLMPVYFEANGTAYSDPISHLTVWRQTCGTPDDFRLKALRFENESTEERESQWHAAVIQIKNYIYPVNDDSILKFIQAVDARRSAQPCIA